MEEIRISIDYKRNARSLDIKSIRLSKLDRDQIRYYK